MFAKLCNHHRNRNDNIFITPKRTLCSLADATISSRPSSTALGNQNSLPLCISWTSHINGIIKYVVFCDWLLSLGTMFSKINHFVAGTLFPLIIKEEPAVWQNHLLFLHLSVDGYLICFSFGATMNTTAVSFHVYSFVWIYL